MYKKYPPTKDRRNIGVVQSPIERMNDVRALSSCCIGIEAMLEDPRSGQQPQTYRGIGKERKPKLWQS